MIRAPTPPPPILTPDDRGLYCAAGDFHIDPWRPVPRAVVTHAHSDHARAGCGHYLATPGTAALLRLRLGAVAVQVLDYGTPLQIGGARVSLHPAGHLPGAAQVRVEVGGEVWVASGDYKTEADGLAEPFEPVPCHGFITECTFGLPVFRWAPQARVAADIRAWWQAAADAGEAAVLGAYALGKAQRLLHLLAGPEAGPGPGPVVVNGAVAASNAALAGAGYALPRVATHPAGTPLTPGTLLIAPPQAMAGAAQRRAAPVRAAMVSGWMALRGIRRRRGLGTGFALSDHADWPGLNAAVQATGATRVRATHGYTAVFARWLAEQGLDADVLSTAWEGETAEPESTAPDRPASAEGLPEPGSPDTLAGGAG